MEKKDNWQHAVIVSAILGTLFSAILFNALHTRAAWFETEFEPTGLGEDGPYSEICGAQFDSYLLSADKWKGRISNYAKEIFDDMAGRALDYFKCNLIFQDVIFQPQGLGFGVGGTQSKTPQCTLDMKDVEASALEAAERELTYDILTRCTANLSVDLSSEFAVQIAQENGPDGGPAWIQSWHDIAPDATQVAMLKSRNTFANTNWCPEIKDELEVLLNFDSNDAYPLDARVDTVGTTFTQEMSCKRDVPLSDLDGDPTWAFRAAMPENDLAFAYVMAKQHESQRIAYEIQTARDQAIAYEGFQPIYEGRTPADRCIDGQEEDEACTKRPNIVVPGSVVRDNIFLANQSQYLKALTADQMGELQDDIRPRLSTLAQDLTTPVIQPDYEPDLATRRYQESDPSQGTIPGGVPQDPSTTRNCGQPSTTECRCLDQPGDPGHLDAQALARNLVASAVGRATFTNPQLFQGTVLPPSNFAQFVTQVCFELGLSSQGCRPYSNRTPPANDVLIFPASGVEYAIDIIRADGTPRTAPTNKYSCTFGVLP